MCTAATYLSGDFYMGRTLDYERGYGEEVVVKPFQQFHLAIGKEGQNARLAARLTGYKIDIRPASQADADEPEAPAELPAEPEEA